MCFGFGKATRTSSTHRAGLNSSGGSKPIGRLARDARSGAAELLLLHVRYRRGCLPNLSWRRCCPRPMRSLHLAPGDELYVEGETKHCPHMHEQFVGLLRTMHRKSWLLPPGLEKRVRRAGRQAQLFLITLVMSYLETDDKILLAGFRRVGRPHLRALRRHVVRRAALPQTACAGRPSPSSVLASISLNGLRCVVHPAPRQAGREY